MDKSFGYNAFSRPEDFIARDDLLWLLADVVAKGGNLLLNVGPRGVDAQIPQEQAERLRWLGQWVVPHGAALWGTRPWVRPGTAIADRNPVRYTATGDSVFALVRHPGSTVTLGAMGTTPVTTVGTLDGARLAWKDTPTGVEIDMGDGPTGPEPVVIAFGGVEPKPGVDSDL
jgi:alpha-L-fucosidase